MTIDDMDLVREYARCRSEQAFASLVSRYVNLVYSVALRRVRDAQLAEEITQSVFMILARKAGSLSAKTVVSGWLCTTARYASAKALTLQRRRHQYEQEACVQAQLSGSDPDAWTRIEPLLDAAMARLGEKDHHALVLRYFEGRNFKDVSEALGTSEAGAKMRVRRALEKLRILLVSQGVTASAAVIAAALSANSIQAAPPDLAASVTAAALKGTAVTATTANLIETTLKLMAWTKLKTALVAGAVILLAVGTATVGGLRHQEANPPASLAFAGYATPEASFQSLVWAASVADFAKFEAASTPDQQERFRRNLARKSAEQMQREAAAWAQTYATCRISRKEIISADEVHLHLTSPRSPDGLRGGNEVLVMKKIGDSWRQAGPRR